MKTSYLLHYIVGMAAFLTWIPVQLHANHQEAREYILKGTLSQFPGSGKAYMNIMGSQRRGDSCIIQDGKFEFRGTLAADETFALVYLFTVTDKQLEKRVQLHPSAFDICQTYLVPGTIILQGDVGVKGSSISGTAIHSDHQAVELARTPAVAMWTSYANAANRLMELGQDTIKKDSMAFYGAQAAHYMQEALGQQVNFVKDHPNAMYSLALLHEWKSSIDQFGATVYASLYEGLSPQLKATPEARSILHQMNNKDAYEVGKPALAFTLVDTAGGDVSLDAYRGKYVLVDFWASWCGPCRAENPHLLNAYKLYKDKGFDILGVSFDHSRERWLKAIAEDKLPWVQVSDLKGMRDSPVAQLYNISGIPQNFVMDPNGLIVAKDLRGKDLERLLESLF